MERSTGQRTTEERVRVMEELWGAGSWLWEAGGAVAWSAGLFRLLGLDAAAIQPNLVFYESLVHPKDRLALEAPASLATDPRQRDRRFRIIRPDGQLRWLRSRAHTVFDRAGNVLRVIGVVTDITDERDMQRRAANDRALIVCLSHLLQIGIWTSDEDGRLLDTVAPGSSGQAVDPGSDSVTWREAVHPDDREAIGRAWREATARRSRYEISPRLLLRDGSYQRVHVAGLPFDPEISSEPLWGGISTFHRGALGAVPASEAPDNEPHLISSNQVRACRALLDWSAETLAMKAGISVSTVRRIESSGATRAQADSVRLITLAFQQGGLVIWRNEDGRFCVSAG